METEQSPLEFLAKRLPVRDLTAEALEDKLPEYVSHSLSNGGPDKEFGALFQDAARVGRVLGDTAYPVDKKFSRRVHLEDVKANRGGWLWNKWGQYGSFSACRGLFAG